MKKGILICSLLLGSFVLYTFLSTGFFRSINTTFAQQVWQRIPVVGAEDIVVPEGKDFALISSTDRRHYPPKAQEKGGLYYLSLNDSVLSPVLLAPNRTTPFAPHGIDVWAASDSTFLVLAINHVGKTHQIEQFRLKQKQLTPIKTWTHPLMVQPNDVVWISPEEFYFTNDHGYTDGLGKVIEEYGGMAWSSVIHVKNGVFQKVADGIAYANGIAHDKKRELLYVASPRHFLVKVYARHTDGTLTFIENIPAGTGVDNITLDGQGRLWIGAHPNLLRFQAYAQGKVPHAPSEILRIDYKEKGNYTVEVMALDDGTTLSGATVAVPYQDKVLVGNVMDDSVVILQQ